MVSMNTLEVQRTMHVVSGRLCYRRMSNTRANGDERGLSTATVGLLGSDACCSYCITVAASVALYVVLWREMSKRKDQPENDEERDRLAFLDLTDKQNAYFRYVL